MGLLLAGTCPHAGLRKTLAQPRAWLLSPSLPGVGSLSVPLSPDHVGSQLGPEVAERWGGDMQQGPHSSLFWRLRAPTWPMADNCSLSSEWLHVGRSGCPCLASSPTALSSVRLSFLSCLPFNTPRGWGPQTREQTSPSPPPHLVLSLGAPPLPPPTPTLSGFRVSPSPCSDHLPALCDLPSTLLPCSSLAASVSPWLSLPPQHSFSLLPGVPLYSWPCLPGASFLPLPLMSLVLWVSPLALHGGLVSLHRWVAGTGSP